MSTNLILIDSNLKDTDILLSALNAQTIGIIYNYDTHRNSILQQIDTAFNVKTIQRVAICCHEGVNQFLENGTFFDLDGSTNEVLKNLNTYFILDLLTTYNASNIDFLACNSLKYDSWRKYYDLIANEVEGVTVGASKDETGNLKYGGNWVMENTGEQIDGIYFNEGLEYYRHLMNDLIENVYKIKVTNNTYIHFAELIAYNELGVNITQNKTSITSSNYGANVASNGNDGNLIAKDSLSSGILHTGNGNSFFEISLGNNYSISKIEIYLFYALPDHLKNRYNEMDIVLLNNNNSAITTFDFPIYDSEDFNNKLTIDDNIHKLTIFNVQPTLDVFTITPTDITIENHGTINMTFSKNVTLTDISNSLTVEPSNAGIIDNITDTSGTVWTADFTPNYGLDLTDCSLNFKHINYSIDQTKYFNINTTLKILDFSLTPSNLVNTDVSSTLRIEFDQTVPSSSNFNITLDPSYIATLGPMSYVSSGFVWEGVLTRTPNMNKLGNKLDFDFSYNGVEVSANLVFDVVENSELVNKNWVLSNSATINNVFTNTLQMSPNGSLMGFINGANVEIYRKSESSNWVSDVSYIGHKFALTNNHIAIASDASLQIYDYSGNSWNIMNGGNIGYVNIVALSINLDGNVVAISNNSNVKVLKNISNYWRHIDTHNDASVIGLSLSPNGLKLGMGIGTVGEDFSSILVKDVIEPVPTFQFSNRSVDLFTGLTMNWNTLVPDYYDQSTKTFTVSGNTINPFLNGDYTLECCGVANNNNTFGPKQMFSDAGTYTSSYKTYAYSTNLPGYGYQSGPYDRHAYGLDDLADGYYVGNTSAGGTFIYYSQLDVSSNAYDGEYIKITFPFYYILTQADIEWGAENDSVNKVAFLGSNDDMNYYYIDGYNIVGNNTLTGYTLNITDNTNYYKIIKLVVQNTNKGTGFNMSRLKFYGDIYNIGDTTNPVVILTGLSEITLNIGDTYIEQGATATDNYDGSLNVVISGDTVDTTTPGTYIVVYSATDSTGNTHSISRTVIILSSQYTLQFYNSTVNLVSSLVDFRANLPTQSVPINQVSTFTLSNNSNYLDGTYEVKSCGCANATYQIKEAFGFTGEYRSINGNLSTDAMIYPSPYDGQSEIGPYNQNPYYDGYYHGFTSNGGTVIYFSQLASNGETYDGKYIEISFPFFVELSKIIIDHRITGINKWTILGSNDKVNYDFIITANENTTLHKINITTTSKYKTIKMVAEEFLYSQSSNFVIREIAVFGDVYT